MGLETLAFTREWAPPVDKPWILECASFWCSQSWLDDSCPTLPLACVLNFLNGSDYKVVACYSRLTKLLQSGPCRTTFKVRLDSCLSLPMEWTELVFNGMVHLKKLWYTNKSPFTSYTTIIPCSNSWSDYPLTWGHVFNTPTYKTFAMCIEHITELQTNNTCVMRGHI